MHQQHCNISDNSALIEQMSQLLRRSMEAVKPATSAARLKIERIPAELPQIALLFSFVGFLFCSVNIILRSLSGQSSPFLKSPLGTSANRIRSLADFGIIPAVFSTVSSQNPPPIASRIASSNLHGWAVARQTIFGAIGPSFVSRKKPNALFSRVKFLAA